MANLLTVKLFSAFVENQKSTPDDLDHPLRRLKPRWGDGVTKTNIIREATGKIPKWNRTSLPAAHDRPGEFQIDISDIKGVFRLQIFPPAMSLCDQPAGPLLGPPNPPAGVPNKELEAAFGNMHRRRFRPIEVDVPMMKGHVYVEPFFPQVAEGTTHGRVIGYHTRKNILLIDWKPDWVSAGESPLRSSRDVNGVDKRHEGFKETGNRVLSSGAGVIVIHHTGTTDNIGKALDWYIDGSTASAHYVIDFDGHVVKLADDRETITWHAGPGAQWEGLQSVNTFAIGIEVVNQHGPFRPAQMSSLLRLLDQLRKQFNIHRDRVLGHCEVSPLVQNKESKAWHIDKRDCPGFEFDWIVLEKSGHATYPAFRDDIKMPAGFDEFFQDAPGDALGHPNRDSHGGQYGKKSRSLASGRSDLVSQLHRNLFELGYEETALGDRGEFSGRTEHLLERFQARYMTKERAQYLGDNREFLGKANSYTVTMMLAVLAAKGRGWQTNW